MRTELFDFDLPASAIALAPAEPRDSARMLRVATGRALSDCLVRELPDVLRPGDAIVLNDTRVIRAALRGTRVRGDVSATVDVTLIERLGANSWRALARPAKRLVTGDKITFRPQGGEKAADRGALPLEHPARDLSLAPDEEVAKVLRAEVIARGDAGAVDLNFDCVGAALDAAIEAVGAMPLPPYIASRRPAGPADVTRYQTVFARVPGAVAAPTAGLHLTGDLLARIAARGVEHHFVTLHVGAGTFLPVKSDDTRDHVMHAEWGEVSVETAAALNEVRRRGGRIVAIGTTALRILESAADPATGDIAAFRGRTAIFITPGYRFRAVDVLMTNFHLPRSTLFMLVAAFAGLDAMKAAYAHALANGYRFYSYGDATLLERSAVASG
jgi:S-adenosylmethionine:tRNA ribosyltransferase-isomerase